MRLFRRACFYKVSTLSLVVMIGGCSSVGELPTNSGKPEITVRSSFAETTNALADWTMSHRFNIVKTTLFSLEGERISDSSSALASHLNIGTHEIVWFNFAQTAEGTHVIGDYRSAGVNFGNQNERTWLQQQLTIVAQSLQKR
jgi:hypothetical protein